MMVAMMVPGAVPATTRHARSDGSARKAAVFAGAYLGVWTLVSIVLYALYPQPSTAVTGSIVIAAGLYELTPVKQNFRRRCRMEMHSGLEFGLSCLGSSIGLMLVLVAVNMMSLPWMVAIAAVVLAQKLFRERTAVDAALALSIISLGALIVFSPSAVPGLMHSM